MAEAANQIAISCQQQLIGINQVTTAMSSISDTTAKLVDHMKESETAINSLNGISENLKSMLDQFNLKSQKIDLNQV
ncbi:MAG: hypothetical protein HWD61_11495 [Parachlamydiaceae bacterium]|nr:MAG: hypothetical protein HWD61_11495 [Parachlamydiaceae bacterium]